MSEVWEWEIKVRREAPALRSVIPIPYWIEAPLGMNSEQHMFNQIHPIYDHDTNYYQVSLPSSFGRTEWTDEQ